MVKSIHDLSEEEICNLSKEIKELLKETKHNKVKNEAGRNKKEAEDESLNWDNFELSSWLTSTEESKDAYMEKMPENFSQKESTKVKNPKSEIKSQSNESESYNIEELIKNDETLQELKNLTSILKNDSNESVLYECELSGSSASEKTLIHKKKTEKSERHSIASSTTLVPCPSSSGTTKTTETDLKLKTLNKHTKIDKTIRNKIQLDSKPTNTKSLSKPQAENIKVSKNNDTDLKPKKPSNTSIRTKKKFSNKDNGKTTSDQPVVKKKPYLEGSPEYKKGHYVPIISKKEKSLKPRTRGKAPSPSISGRSPSMSKKIEDVVAAIKKREKIQSELRMSEEVGPLFPLKIDSISMFSSDEEQESEGEVDDEDVEEEESSSESGSGPGEPEVMLNELWKDLLLPTDESDMDLNEFYKQFPKLKKMKTSERLILSRENIEQQYSSSIDHMMSK